MTSDLDQIREQIEETRTSLSEDVNTLADTVNPAHAAKRTAASARSAVLGVKDKVTGHHQDPVWCPAGHCGAGLPAGPNQTSLSTWFLWSRSRPPA
jgi:Protein of unknown function (DUF3618)